MDLNKEDVWSVIEEKFFGLSKSHKAIALFIRENYDKAVFMTAAQIGEELKISESTVVRFASNLGYDGYPEFQKFFSDWVRNKMSKGPSAEGESSNNSKSQIIDSVLKGDRARLNDTLSMLDTEAFEKAVDVIAKAKKVYVIGIRTCSPLADFLSFYLNLIRDNVVCISTTSASETFEQMLRIGKDDAIIGISFPNYSMRTLKALEFASDRNAQVITLTDSLHSPVCMYSNINLVAQSDMVSIVGSLVAPLSVINAIVVALCLKMPDAIRANYEKLEEAWNNYQVYLNDDINFVDNDPITDKSLLDSE